MSKLCRTKSPIFDPLTYHQENFENVINLDLWWCGLKKVGWRKRYAFFSTKGYSEVQLLHRQCFQAHCKTFEVRPTQKWKSDFATRHGSEIWCKSCQKLTSNSFHRFHLVTRILSASRDFNLPDYDLRCNIETMACSKLNTNMEDLKNVCLTVLDNFPLETACTPSHRPHFRLRKPVHSRR